MIYYTADPHFGYEPLVAGRGFASAAEMDEALIAAWNGVVSPEDTVYLVGDIGWNGGHVPCRTLARLNGHKHLIRGNHDTGYRDGPLLYRCFESVTDFLEIDDGQHHIFLSHYPMLFSKPNGYMIHGHIHASGQFHEILRDMPRVLNAGVDVNGFAPVTLAQLIGNNEAFYSRDYTVRPYRRAGKGLLPGIPDFQPVPQRPGPHPKHLFLTGSGSAVLDRLLEGRDADLVRLDGPETGEILAALDGDTPVYCAARHPIPDEIAAREDVCVIYVTEENRNDLPRKLLEQGW